MFTGLVSDVGEVLSANGSRLEIGTRLAAEIAAGDSVAVAGVCLTATEVGERGFGVDVMPVTMSRTTLGGLAPGGAVNLEPALRASDRLGGHIVSGHADGVGEVVAATADGIATRLRIRPPAELARYLVARGSVAIEGVSLTISELDGEVFEVSLIPETRQRTTLGRLEAGDSVNLEVDLVARYVERLVQSFTGEGSHP